jgi:hypothetical protein
VDKNRRMVGQPKTLNTTPSTQFHSMIYEFDDNGNMMCCENGMTYHFEWEQSNTPSYSDEDKWICEVCNFTLPSRRYSDWFGSGDLHQEVADYLEASADEKGMPLRIFFDGYMACLVYAEDVVIFGYDGNEYTHSFHFTNEEPNRQPFISQVLGLEKLTLVDEEE